MAKYSADIEIAVRGGQQVDGLIKNLNRLNNSINVVNRNAKLLEGKGFNIASMENYSRAVFKAENALRKAAQGTKQEEMAVRSLVTAMDAENKARSRRNFLIAQEVASRRQVIATANAGVGVQGPQAANLRTARGPASPIRGTVNMPGSPAALATTAGRTASREAGISGRLGGAVSGSIIGGAFPLLFGQGGGAAAGGAIGGLVGGLAGPGGSFAGSLLGTLLGDIASRGQSVKQLGEDLGFSTTQAKTLADAFKTANTDVEKFTAVIQNIRGVGLELEEQATAVQLVTALTEKYGGSFEKVGNAITSALESGKVSQAVLNQLTSQGVTVQDALAAKYDVSRDKILEMAKKGEISVQSLLDTLVELGNASTTAAEKTQTPFEKALSTTGQLFQSFWKDVQTIFAGVSSSGVEAGTALLNIFNKLLQEVLFPLGRFLARIAALFVDVVSTGVRAAAELINGFRGVSSAIGNALMGIVNMIPGLRTIVGLARQLFKGATGTKSSDWNDMPWPEGIPKPGSPGMIGRILAPSQAAPTGGTRAGTKPPEDRTAQMTADLNALKIQLTTQNGIRDALYDGNKALAIRLQADQEIADIERDREKALLNANYESERAVIYATEIIRKRAVELEYADELRQLEKDITDEYYRRANLDLRNLTQQKGAGAFLLDINLDPNNTAVQKVDEMKDRLQDLSDPINMAATGAKGIGDAFSVAFQGIIAGTQSTQEALSNFFKGVGDAFISMATEIIAQMVVMFAFKQLLGLFGGGGGGLFSGAGPVALPQGPGFAAGFSLPAFAEGGFVTSPTSALIGEGGEPEYVIPASKMRSAMARYSAGARGESVIPGSGNTGDMGMGTGNESGVGTIDVRYTVERINNVDYVTADQFQAGMRQAAEQGARKGEQRTLSRLQNAPSARRRIGI